MVFLRGSIPNDGKDRDGICKSWGQYHFETFDGIYYYFPGNCSYIFAKDCSAPEPQYTVWVHNSPQCDGSVYSCLRSISLFFASQEEIVIVGQEVKKESIRLTLPQTIGNVFIERLADYILVKTTFGFSLAWDGSTGIYIKLTEEHKGKPCGLCGNYNGNKSDDLIIQNTECTIVGDSHFTTFDGRHYTFLGICQYILVKGTGKDKFTITLQKAPCGQNLDHACIQSVTLVLEDDRSKQVTLTRDGEIQFGPSQGFNFNGDIEIRNLSSLFVQLKTRFGLKIQFAKDGERLYIQVNTSWKRRTLGLCGTFNGNLRDDFLSPAGMIEGTPQLHANAWKVSSACFAPVNVPVVDPCNVNQQNVHTCPEGKIYYDCRYSVPGLPAAGVNCEISCANLAMNFTCVPSPPCASGCICPPGMAEHKGKCYVPDSCPCTWKDWEYLSGEVIATPCYTCVCRRGIFTCTSYPCPAVCTVYGDRHYYTFDGLEYDYVSDCQAYLVKSTDNSNVSVIAQNKKCFDNDIVCSKSVLISVGDTEIYFSEPSDKQRTARGQEKNPTYQLWKAGYYTVVHFPEQEITILWDKKTTIHVKVGPRWKGKLAGLCGNFDKYTSNDLTTSNNMEVRNAQVFGESWAIGQCKSPNETIKPCEVHQSKFPYAKRECSILYSDVFAPCRNVIDVTSFVKNCHTDTCNCNLGGDSYNCEYYNQGLGEGPYILASYGQNDTVIGANITSRKLFPLPRISTYENVGFSFMITPGLFKDKDLSLSLVSLESAERPNYFLYVHDNETVTLEQWSANSSFRRRATFFHHQGLWIPDYSAFELHNKKGFFIILTASGIKVSKYDDSEEFKHTSSFSIEDLHASVPYRRMCEWRYEPCASPCFKTCSDPEGVACKFLPPVEGCLPYCPKNMIVDEVTLKCVYPEDCIPVTPTELTAGTKTQRTRPTALIFPTIVTTERFPQMPPIFVTAEAEAEPTHTITTSLPSQSSITSGKSVSISELSDVKLSDWSRIPPQRTIKPSYNLTEPEQVGIGESQSTTLTDSSHFSYAKVLSSTTEPVETQTSLTDTDMMMRVTADNASYGTMIHTLMSSSSDCMPRYIEPVDRCSQYVCINMGWMLYNVSRNCHKNVEKPDCGFRGMPVQVNSDSCCPEWECPCQCSILSELSIITFDGNNIALYNMASYILVKLPGEIIVAHIEKCPTNRVVVDSVIQPLPFSKHGLCIQDTGAMYVINTPAGISIKWAHVTGIIDIQYGLHSNTSTKTEGLCGVCNGDPVDDLKMQNRTIITNMEEIEAFIKSWEIEKSVDVATRRPVSPQDFCEKMWINNTYFWNYECDALSAYVALCNKHNICIKWRTPDYCSLGCPDGKEYQPCVQPCAAKTCLNKWFYEESPCSYLREDCVCKNGTILHRTDSDLCIPEEKCACTDNEGQPRSAGEVWNGSIKGCCMYNCLENGSVIAIEPECSEDPLPVCEREGEVIINVIEERACCPKKVCECNMTLCEAIIPTCKNGEKLMVGYSTLSCCPQYQCECDPLACPNAPRPECREDQFIVEAKQEDPCCFSYLCVCESCIEPVPLCNEGEILTVDLSTMHSCCPRYHCVCDENRCSVPLLNCTADMQLVKEKVPGQCCPGWHCECSCENFTIPTCKVYLDENLCYTVQCLQEKDHSTGYHAMDFTVVNCSQQCDAHQIYIPSPSHHVCCGTCQNVSCAFYTENGTLSVHEEGSTWASNCTKYECAKTAVGAMILGSSVVCPPFNETECTKNGGTVQTYNDGCCKTCRKEERICQKVTVRTTIRKSDCISQRPINVASCEGKCPSATIFNVNINSHLRFCKCCRENGVQNLTVPLYCSGNGTEVMYIIQEPTDCSCQWN
ncbi:unnamed protein product [Caretta caretta]